MHTGHSFAFTKMMFSSVVSQERFQSIIRFLHFGNESQQLDHGLAKMRFLINHLNNTTPGIYTPHEELSLDESIMLWRVNYCFGNILKTEGINTELNSLNYARIMDGLVLKAQFHSETKFKDTESIRQTGHIACTSWNLILTKTTMWSQTTGTILYHSHNICQRRTHILLVTCMLIESETH